MGVKITQLDQETPNVTELVMNCFVNAKRLHSEKERLNCD